MADIGSLSGLLPVEQLDLENYADNKASEFRLPAKGTYTLRARDSFPADAFGASKAGALTVAIDPTIVGGDHDGFKIRFQKVSAKVYQRKGKNVSQLGDYLRACGFKGTLKTVQDLADAAESTANTIFQAKVDWRAYKDGFSVEGMEKFPKLEDGTYQSWVEHPTAKDADGNPVRVWANLTITDYIPVED